MPPYGSGRTPDMIETPLRSMINRVLWKAMLISVPSTMLFHRWAVKHGFLFPCIRYLVCPRSDHSINHTIVQSRYRQTPLLVPVTLHIPVTESHVCKLDGCNCHRVGPGYLSVTRTYRSWSWCILLNLRSLEYLKDAFQTTGVNGSHWRNQGSCRR